MKTSTKELICNTYREVYIGNIISLPRFYQLIKEIIKEEKMVLDKDKDYWIVDITKLNNSWRLKQEIKDSNCKIVKIISKVKCKHSESKR